VLEASLADMRNMMQIVPIERDEKEKRERERESELL
jgi:hypothetical protein